MSDITIPPAALDAAVHELFAHPSDPIDWEIARAACLAMLKNWPGMKHRAHGLIAPSIILPLTEKPE